MILLGGGSIPKRHQVGQFEIGVDKTAKVDSSSRIRFETNAYSVPWQYVHRTVEVKAFAVFKTNVA